MNQSINKSMDREDLLTEEGQAFVAELNRLAVTLESRKLPVTSWYGGLPEPRIGPSIAGMKALARRVLGRTRPPRIIGEVNRGGSSYQPLPGIATEDRHPWFLFWEAYWVMRNGPTLGPNLKVLDAGGTGSLFSCFLASRGAEVYAVDLNRELLASGDRIASAMGWKVESHCMNMADLKFEDNSIDHAYSICVFEHLTSDLRRRALREIARVLKPGGWLSITFDYRGPGVALAGQGPNYDAENLIDTPEAVQRHFLSTGCLEVVSNPEFEDNGKSYLTWPSDLSKHYTFGAVFLRKPA